MEEGKLATKQETEFDKIIKQLEDIQLGIDKMVTHIETKIDAIADIINIETPSDECSMTKMVTTPKFIDNMQDKIKSLANSLKRLERIKNDLDKII